MAYSRTHRAYVSRLTSIILSTIVAIYSYSLVGTVIQIQFVAGTCDSVCKAHIILEFLPLCSSVHMEGGEHRAVKQKPDKTPQIPGIILCAF